jgi:DNA sulfur modification protein DndC
MFPALFKSLQLGYATPLPWVVEVYPVARQPDALWDDGAAEAVPSDDIVAKLNFMRAQLRDEYTQPHEKPWIIGFSGGKDSTLVLQLVFDMLLELPASMRKRKVHVLSNDTLVESPAVQSFVDKVLADLTDAVEALNVPVVVKKTIPEPDHTFWVNLIGRGYPAPNRLFRWCTDRMKIRPTIDYIKKQVSEAGEAILLLGVRRLESSARAKVVGRYDNGGRLNPHNDIKGCFVFRPIVELSTDEVWTILLQLRPAWGGTHRPLVTLYRNANSGECPFVTDQSDAPSCGTSNSRFGCWTCTVVEKDRSMQGFLLNGYEHLEPLADFRDWLQEFSRTPANRMTERRNGQDGQGPFTLEARKEILDRLLEIQKEVGISLVSEAELARIEELWKQDVSLFAVRKADRILALIDNET